ncbi:MAG TPA: ABC transporter substrate-binding protein [Bacilli bacterium]
MKNALGKHLSHILVYTLVVLLVFSLAACGGKNNTPAPTETESPAAETAAPATAKPAEKVTISFWNGFTGPDGELLKTIVDEYNAKNADTVEIKMDIMPWDQLFQKLPPAIATKTAPSLVVMWPGAAAPYIGNGSFLPLDDFFPTTGADQSDFMASSLEMGQNRDGKQFMLPMQTNGIYLFWNKTLFTAAGLDPNKAPESLDQLAEYAVKITDKSKNQFGLALPVKGSPTHFVSFLKGNGGDVVDLAAMKSVLNSPANVQTFKWIQDLAMNKKVSPNGATGADMDKLMLAGQLGMFITGPWLSGGLKANNIDYGVAVPPRGSVTQFTEVSGIGFAVPDGTTPEQKKAAYDFIKYWNSTEIGKKWSLANGFPPYLKSVIGDPEIQGNANIAAMANMGDAGQPFLKGLLNASKIADVEMYKMVEAIQLGADVEKELQKTSDIIDEILKTEP